MTSETHTADQAGLDQLAKVTAEFENWHRQKKSRAERIPESLLREAQKLSQHYQAYYVMTGKDSAYSTLVIGTPGMAETIAYSYWL